ncbi:hypothetical protein GCM10010272_15400 [Streptomyces lateritius]|nr:hypothetical protein GCM10010272_15400 [Streptomyces lateritius]
MVRFTTVDLSVVASYRMRKSPRGVRTWSTRTRRVPGYPISPSALTYRRVRPVRSLCVRLDVPHPLVEALVPAVQAVGTVVDGGPVRASVEGEGAAGDAVAVAADDRAEVRAARDVVLEVVEAQRHVRVAPAPVGDFQGLDDAAVRQPSPYVC